MMVKKQICDTLVALGNSTEDGSIIFGKNSDRPDDEVQLITYVPSMKYSKGEQLQCTYISIPQVIETAEVLLSQPWWMWGAEMGANQYSVVIGNEAVHTLEPLNRTGLLGMDLLRLGLERGKNAIETVNVITGLLEEFGQGGGCAHGDSSWMYHNSFLIADSKEAYVLETADKWWIVEKVKDVRSISNSISIRGEGDLRRKGIIQHAIESGYSKDDNDFDFASTFSGSRLSNTPSPFSRGGKSTLLLEENRGKITPELMMGFLREHDAGICMHGGFESTGSQVSCLNDEHASIHWFTGTTLPCLSNFKPYHFPIDHQEVLKPSPYSKIDLDWFWIKHSSKMAPFKGYSINLDKKKYVKSLLAIENSSVERINDVISKKEKYSQEEFNNILKKINFDAWERSKKLIE